MTWRTPFAALLFAAGAYTAVSDLVDSWEGGICWLRGDTNYVRLPFVTAFLGAAHALLGKAPTKPFSMIVDLLILTAFLWPVAAVLIADRRVISISILAGLLTLVPFGITVHGQMLFGIETFCDGNGMAAFGSAVLQLFIVLPIGIFVFCTAMRA